MNAQTCEGAQEPEALFRGQGRLDRFYGLKLGGPGEGVQRGQASRGGRGAGVRRWRDGRGLGSFRFIGCAHDNAIAGPHLRCGEGVERQQQDAGWGTGEWRDFVVGNQFDVVKDAGVAVEVDEIVGGETGNGGNVFEGVEPEACIGVGSEAFDEDLDGLERIGARVDDGDTGAEEAFAGLVVDAEFAGGHGSQSKVNKSPRSSRKQTGEHWMTREATKRAKATKKLNTSRACGGQGQRLRYVPEPDAGDRSCAHAYFPTWGHSLASN